MIEVFVSHEDFIGINVLRYPKESDKSLMCRIISLELDRKNIPHIKPQPYKPEEFIKQFKNIRTQQVPCSLGTQFTFEFTLKNKVKNFFIYLWRTRK